MLVASARLRAQQLPWDGLDELRRVAQEAHIELRAPEKLDLSKLSPNDALLIIEPQQTLPVGPLTSFLREGGRIALLDDVGSGERLLAAYQVARSPAPTVEVPALRGDPQLLIAYPASEHPLVEGVPLLLTNRPTELLHPELKPVFTFGHSNHALVLAGAVGSGRLVAVGDGSVLINQLMSVPAHRRFAKNLLEYLARPAGRSFLITKDTAIEGSYGEKGNLSRLDAWLKRLAHPDLPPAVLSLLALALCGIAAVLAAGTLPRRSPYVRPELFPDAAVYAGFAGRVSAGEREGVNLLWSLLDYKRELEAELAHRLGLSGPFGRADAAAFARTKGLPSQWTRELDELFSYLERLAYDADHAEEKARVSVSELGNVVRQGEELLARLRNDDE